MQLYAKHIQRDIHDNPSQYHYYTPWHQDDPLIIASLFENSVYVAILGFDNDANFEFKRDKSKSIVDDLKDNIKKHPKAQRRLIKVGVFDGD